MRIAALLFCVASTVAGAALANTDNSRLTKIYEQDQSDRKPGHTLNGDQIVARDEERQEAVLRIMREGGLSTANDYFHAAMVFQHSNAPENNALAYGLAVTAARIDPANKMAKWLSAAAWDRALMRRNKPQWYGTQFVKNFGTGKWELYRVDETAVTDTDRENTGVPPLARQRDREKELNGETAEQKPPA
jgi:hypothetical protein